MYQVVDGQGTATATRLMPRGENLDPVGCVSVACGACSSNTNAITSMMMERIAEGMQ